MPLDAKKAARLKTLLASDEMSDEVRAQAEEALAEWEGRFTAEAAKGMSFPDAGAYTPPTEEQMREMVGRSGEQAIIDRLDPSISVPAQILSTQPATTHPKGDKAAADEWARGRLDNPNGVDVYFEAPAAKVREDLMNNPEMFRVLGFEPPMGSEAIEQLVTSGSPIHQAYNDHHFRGAADRAVKEGRTAYRYSKAPYMQGGEHGNPLSTFTTKAWNAFAPAVEQGRALVLGYDTAANWGAGTAGAEGTRDRFQAELNKVGAKASDAEAARNPEYARKREEYRAKKAEEGPEGKLAIQQDVSLREQNDMVREEHPYLEAVGEVAGMAQGLLGKGAAKAASALDNAAGGVVRRAGKAVAEGAERTLAQLREWAPSTGAWEWAASGAGPGWTAAPKSALGRFGADVAHGAASAAADQLATDAVTIGANLRDRGEAGLSGKEVATRAGVAGLAGAAITTPFAAAARGGRAGTQYVEDRFPEIEEAAPHLNWGLPSLALGPRLKPETKELVRQARKEGVSPVAIQAEEIAPAMRQRASERLAETTGRHAAETTAHHATPEGQAGGKLTNLVQSTLDVQRAHHQPTAAGGQRPVTTKTRAARQLFNMHVGEASFDPTPGAIELNASEATHFLSPVNQGRLFRKDVADAAARRASKPIDRKALIEAKLGKLSPKRRAIAQRELDDEIDQAISDILVPKEKFGKSFDERSVEYKAAEQQVLGEIRDTDEVLEPFGGSLAEYMKQRGKGKVYVTPHEVDAKRIETVIGSLEGGSGNQAGRELEGFRQAALSDRKARPGGFDEMRRRQDTELAAEREVSEAVAPGGDAFEGVVKHGIPRVGDRRDVRALRQVADEAGVRPQLDKIRSMQAAEELTSRGFFAGSRDPLRRVHPKVGRLANAADAIALRSYPIMRGLDKMSPIAPAMTARMRSLGEGREDAAERRQKRDAARMPEYEKKVGATGGRSGRLTRSAMKRASELEQVRQARERVQQRRLQK